MTELSKNFKVRAQQLAQISHAQNPMEFDEIVRKTGEVEKPNGQVVSFHMVPSVDAFVTDGKSVLLISRDKKNPTQKTRFPGGWVDSSDGSPVGTALRETEEETTIDLKDKEYTASVLKPLNIENTTDIRGAWEDVPERGIKLRDMFVVGAHTVLIEISEELMNTFRPEGKDDAVWADVVPFEDLQSGKVKIANYHKEILTEFGYLQDKTVAATDELETPSV